MFMPVCQLRASVRPSDISTNNMVCKAVPCWLVSLFRHGGKIKVVFAAAKRTFLNLLHAPRVSFYNIIDDYCIYTYTLKLEIFSVTAVLTSYLHK